ncbi:MAG: hypothetical protein GX601_16195 [Anaerolineales bacterium]|nr:hypothetical protein [Anaerolineales bacterium]
MAPASFSFETFLHPPRSARPMVRWWWPGTDVEREELLREVHDLDEAGFLGGEIQAFMVGCPKDLERRSPARWQRSHRFMQPHYYQMVRAVLDEAALRGMQFDLTICSGWPAGNSSVTKADSLKMLLMGAKTVKGGRSYHGRLPRFKRPLIYAASHFIGLVREMVTYMPEDFRPVAVVAGRPVAKPGRVRSFRPTTTLLETESLIDLTDHVDEKGALHWDVPEGIWQIFAFYSGPSGGRPLGAAREKPDARSLVLDHFASEPIQKHLEQHFGQAPDSLKPHFGHALRAFFTDSLELMPEWTWTDDFLGEFEQRRGYDLTPYLPVNYVPGRDNKYLSVIMSALRPCFDLEGGLGERVRQDFEQTVSDLFTERFVQAMTDWAETHGLRSRIQAYGVRADTLKAYGIAHIPETEQLYAGGMLDFLRLAGSAAAIYDKPLVTAESMVWSQRDYLTTPLKWKVAADRLFVAGVNQMIYHGFPYQHPDFPYPGYQPFSSPYIPKQMCFSSNFSRANPFWEFFPRMNAYVTRCQYALQSGRPVANVGLYYPLFNYPDAALKREELIGGLLDENDAPLARRAVGGGIKKTLDDEERWALGQARLADELAARGYSTVHINAERLLAATIDPGQLVIGATRLEAIVLSHVTSITVEVARKLREAAEAGVCVVFVGQPPDRQPGLHNYLENDARVAEITHSIAERFGGMLEDAAAAPGLLAERGVRPGVTFEAPQPSIHSIHRQTEGADIYFLRHAGSEPVTVWAGFPHPDRVPTVLDPWSGATIPAAHYQVQSGEVRLPLEFSAYGSVLLAFVPGPEPLHVVRCDPPVAREGDRLVAYVSKAGDYAFGLSDGARPLHHVAAAPAPLQIDEWELSTQLRAYTGNITPLHLELDTLQDWREISQLKYSSNKGVYSTRVLLHGRYLQQGLRLTLDLGRVCDVAEVVVNGRRFEPLLSYPFAVDITDWVRVGDNEIKITVTATLRNQLVQYGRLGGADWKQFRGRRELAPSGLLGPVTLVPEWRVEIV